MEFPFSHVVKLSLKGIAAYVAGGAIHVPGE
jgi:hypothetical protein